MVPSLISGCNRSKRARLSVMVFNSRIGRYRLRIRSSDGATPADSNSCEDWNDRLGALLGAIRAENPDLGLVIDRWADLPAAVRAGIIAMVKTTGSGP